VAFQANKKQICTVVTGFIPKASRLLPRGDRRKGRTGMRRKMLRELALTAAALLPGIALAADPPPQDKISGLTGVTFTSDYNSRGLLLENQGFIAQPYGELDFLITESKDGPLNKLTLFGGVWSSLHSEGTFAQHSPTDWFEFDWYVGASADWGKLNTAFSYWEFISPNGAFGTARNFQLKLSYDDTSLWNNKPWEGFGLKPYAIIFVETAGKAGTGKDRGIYLELGVAPSYTFSPKSDYPITVAVPVTVGLGFSDFYGDGSASNDNEFYGFSSIGVAASVPLKFMSDYGAWTLTAGGYFYHFGPGVDWFNKATTAGDSDIDLVGSVGVSIAF